MEDTMEADVPMLVFRLRSGKTYKTEWHLATSQADVDDRVASMNAQRNQGDVWEAEVIEVVVESFDVRRIGGFLMGKIKSFARAYASAANGKKGGRPRKEKPSTGL